MPDDVHYFIGFPVPQERREILSEWQKILEHYVDYRKWVHMDDFHITIRFLGALSKSQLRELKRKLVTVECAAFDISVEGINFFGKEDQPRVMYAEINRSEQILSIKAQVDDLLNQLKFDEESRPYRPHITLAKKWDKGKLHMSKDALENKIDDEKYFKFHIDRFNIYRVNPDRKQKYEVIASFNLK
ncbi:RNA 2',3'-cyclic phosphodiesterase [Filobacillus milosensis]|uniref:RNA 2',3'-cyclic phosphodiesterase n=1 Tax=Filobacillus milosensis TaxID=94137 RepID=A0A4Y8IV41_9BACI|nr:RNA 2',3'-cyclic phosphodiesterase [Filobacillus milosensis]TFB25096.1 RNA 2',3'-cyclic phosphodiesterase [Filobacillus milosensis]